MTKARRLQLGQASAYLFCIVIVWKYGISLEGTDFTGGRFTGPILDMEDLGAILFLLALLMAFFSKKISAAAALIAAALCFPLFFYFIAPGPFRWLFKGEYSVPLSANFVWDTWTIIGVLAVAVATYFSIRALLFSHPPKEQNSG